MRALRALAVAAMLVPSLARALPRVALSLEGALSRWPQKPRLAAGGALSARLALAELALATEWAPREPSGEAGFQGSLLVGGGLGHDASPLASLHAHALAGGYWVRLRDYVHGGWRHESAPALGGRLGVRLHPDASLGRGPRIWPLAGLWITVLRVERHRDLLRAFEWGGTAVVVSLTLGAELTGPARHPSREP